MKKSIYIILFFFLSNITLPIYSQAIDADPLPNPIRNYTMDGGEAKDLANNKNGTFHGSIYACKDRFDIDRKALRLTTNAYIETPSFFEGSDVSNGYTISFWTKIDEDISKNSGNEPWNTNDISYQAFFARTGTTTADNTLLGFDRRRDRAIIDRYIQNGQTKKDWGVWFWDPVNFTNKIGWYHIILVYDKAQVYLYMYDPNSALQSGLYYFKLQSLSDAKVWGLGGLINDSFKYLDDFKIFNEPFNKGQIEALHGFEAIPKGGMYRINLQQDYFVSIGTAGQSRRQTSDVEVYNKFEPNTSVYQWVFEEVKEKSNTYKIRMAYEDDMYLHLKNHSISAGVRVEILPYNANNPNSYEWLVIPTYSNNNTYSTFYIQNASNPDLYLHTVGNNISPGTRLELWPFNWNYRMTYGWYLVLIQTQAEINSNIIGYNESNITSAENTFLNLQPFNPNDNNHSFVGVSRSPNLPNNDNKWEFSECVDGSYYIKRSGPLFMHLEGRNLNPNTRTEVWDFTLDNYYKPFYRWIIKRAAPFSNNYIINPVLNNTLSLNSGQPTKNKNDVKTIQNNAVNERSSQWNIYSEKDGYNQIYFIKPGTYRISSIVDTKKYITTSGLSSSNGTPLVIRNFDEQNCTSFYWEIDYEKDTNGNPIQDGTYLVKLFKTNNNYFHTKSNNLEEWARVEIWGMTEEYIASYKWFIIASDNKDGYYIKMAGNNEMYLHLNSNNIGDNTPLDLSKYYASAMQYMTWKLEKIP